MSTARRGTAVGPPVPFLDLGRLHATMGPALQEAMDAVLATSSFIGGPHVQQFEQAWAAKCGTAFAVGVGSGTDAIELALRGLGIGPGDEVLLPTNTFVATAEAVVHAGAAPVFTDVRPDTLLIDLEDAATAVTARTAAIIPVHLYGQPVDMDAVMRFAAHHRLAVVEDAAQAHGARWRGRPVGSFGHAGCFSFYPGKNLGALGDGGAVVTNDEHLAEQIRSLADHGRALDSKYLHQSVGTNSRLDSLQAAVLTRKLEWLDGWTAQRREVAARYDEALSGTTVRRTAVDERADGVHHLYVIRAEGRDDLAEHLLARRIGTGVHYPVPCHEQPALEAHASRPLPVAEHASRRLLSLPMSPTMALAQVDQVADGIRDAGWTDDGGALR